MDRTRYGPPLIGLGCWLVAVLAAAWPATPCASPPPRIAPRLFPAWEQELATAAWDLLPGLQPRPGHETSCRLEMEGLARAVRAGEPDQAARLLRLLRWLERDPSSSARERLAFDSAAASALERALVAPREDPLRRAAWLARLEGLPGERCGPPVTLQELIDEANLALRALRRAEDDQRLVPPAFLRCGAVAQALLSEDRAVYRRNGAAVLARARSLLQRSAQRTGR